MAIPQADLTAKQGFPFAATIQLYQSSGIVQQLEDVTVIKFRLYQRGDTTSLGEWTLTEDVTADEAALLIPQNAIDALTAYANYRYVVYAVDASTNSVPMVEGRFFVEREFA